MSAVEPDGRRWVVLISYTLIAMSSQIVWLNFAGIATPQTEGIFNVGIDSIALLSAVWPLVFIPLSLPVGLLVDRWGFRVSVLIVGAVLAIFSWLRIISGTDFTLLFVFQSIASISQPFVYSSITKLAGNWFPKSEQTLANGIGTLGQIAGMIVALTVVPLMVPSPLYSELRDNFIVVSLIATVSLLLFLAYARERPALSLNYPAHSEGVSTLGNMKALLKLRNIVVLMLLFLIGVGIFSGIVQWIEAILYSRGISSLYGGLTGSAMLIGGILGMIVIPIIADMLGKLKSILVTNTLITGVFLLLFSLRASLAFYIIAASLIGFFLLSLAPVGLELSYLTAGERRAGTAAAMVWLTSQVGALFFILLLPALEAFQVKIGLMPDNPWFLAVLSMSLFMLACSGLSFLIKERTSTS